ncbi:MAG: hypothetical protein FJW40_23190 [Acidobacteria bacterium]|nr:hypothetical protein [Acidobacteriota bacterium]
MTAQATDPFDCLDSLIASQGAGAAFRFLAERFQQEKRYPALFELRTLAKRLELGLPLVGGQGMEDIPAALRPEYERCFLDAARETGGLFLSDGDIVRAWPYFRAIGDPAPVKAAIESLAPARGEESQDAILEIALHERVHPRKAFELILANYGTCRAITIFGQYPGPEAREESLQLLVATIYQELAANLARSVEEAEGAAPASTRVIHLIAGRAWLFEGMNYFIDTSHLVTVLRYAIDLESPEHLRMAIEMAAYGACLNEMFHHRGDPPFENIYADTAAYLKVLLGEDVEASLDHFRAKAAAADVEVDGGAAAQALVVLLARAGKYREAVEVSREKLAGVSPQYLICPSIPQLCQRSGDYALLAEISRSGGDLLNYTAATLQRLGTP